MLNLIGRMPLPPYIKREKDHDEAGRSGPIPLSDRLRTGARCSRGSHRALHFSDELFESLASQGIERTFVTLHVGIGTFKPVTADTLEEHAMHVESYSIDSAAADALNRAKREGRRIVAVGTTAARVLESQPTDELFRPRSDQTGILIYPRYHWKHVDALITNFHLPRSTLIALVAAMVGLNEQRRLYQIAIEEKYRFFSYGDAMLIGS